MHLESHFSTNGHALLEKVSFNQYLSVNVNFVDILTKQMGVGDHVQVLNVSKGHVPRKYFEGGGPLPGP